MRRKVCGSPTPPAQITGQAEVAHLREKRLWRELARVASSNVVHGDQAVDAALDGFLRPFPLGHVVVDHTTHLRGFVDHPARIAERRDEKPHALLERDVDPALEPFAVGF
jgi:hypothetical protein